MNPFKTFETIKSDYLSYIRTFQKFREKRFEDFVNERTDHHEMLWKEPLVQIARKFRTGRPLEDFVGENGLDPRIPAIFSKDGKPLRPYHHQAEAIRIGVMEKKNFVVTTGTGSGKSLCFEIPVINHCLQAAARNLKGIKAIIIYPMNALANSQYEEMARKLAGTGITIGLYTGDTAYTDEDGLRKYREVFGEEAAPKDSEIISRLAMHRNPPDILVTNYVELELLLTRFEDRNLFAEEYKSNLQFLVIDELHTYSGKKGADVAFLIRRLKQRTGTAGKLQCIGTSATLVSENDQAGSEETAARFAGLFFGEPFGTEHVIGEKEDESLKFAGDRINPVFGISRKDLDGYNEEDTGSVIPLYEALMGEKYSGELLDTMLGRELKRSLTLTFIENEFQDRPKSLKEAARVYQKSHRPKLSLEECHAELIAGLILGFAGKIETPDGLVVPRFIPKLHTFFNQGRELRACLADGCGYLSDKGEVTCPECERRGRPFSTLYPVHFCRVCGQEYYGMTYDKHTGETKPWNILNWDDTDKAGYYSPDYFVHNPEDLPENWRTPKKGDVKKAHLEKVPKNGILDPVENRFNLSYDESDGTGVFLPWPFAWCLNCQTEHSGQVRENTKLFLLNSIGRATGSDIILSSTIQNALPKERKIIGFSDNRQDAAFQAGHFNDWYGQIFFRKALRQVLWDESEPIPVRELPKKLIKVIMGSGFPSTPRDRMFERNYLRYLETYLFVEIRGTKKFTSINLEDTGLIEIGYDFLKEYVEGRKKPDQYPLLAKTDSLLLFEYLTGFLDIFRMEVAVGHNDLINKEVFRQEVISFIENYQEYPNKRYFEAVENTKPGGFTDGDQHNIHFKYNPHALSKSQRFSSWIRKALGPADPDETAQVLQQTLDYLLEAGYLVSLNENQTRVIVLSPELITIRPAREGFRQVCKRCDSKYNWRVLNHCIQLKCKDPLEPYREKHNYYFEQYRQPVDHALTIRAEDHSAQVSGLDRKKREKAFREEKLQVLMASPTMELGIDIGTLSSVFLRNVPPNPSNYAQRSGRAGRSGQGSLISTFCGSGPGRGAHDQYYYNSPEEIISGKMAMPRFNLQNETLFQAHVNSLVLQAIETKMEGMPGLILDFSNSGMRYPMRVDLKEELTQRVNQSKDVILATILSAFKDEIVTEGSVFSGSNISSQISQFVNLLDIAFNLLREDYFENEKEIKALDEPIRHGDQAGSDSNQARRKALEIRNQNIRNGEEEFNTYSYLSGVGFLPNYAFPRKTIQLRFYLNQEEEAITRDHQIALSEFAPTNTIYHSGQKFTIDNISKETDINNQVKFIICPSCDFIRESGMKKDNSGPVLPKPSNCPVCGTPWNNAHEVGALRMPRMRAKRTTRITSEEEERTRAGFEIVKSYYPSGREVTKKYFKGSEAITTISFDRSARLYQINRGSRLDIRQGAAGFILDPDAGKWISRTKIDEYYANNPGGRLRMRSNIHLYIESLNDVLIFKSTRHHGEQEETFLRTLQYVLSSAICRILNLDESEMDGFIQLIPEKSGKVFIYERSDGGTGTLSSILKSELLLKKITGKALEILHFDHEGKDTKDACSTVCYDCICTFYNQRYHSLLNRKAVRDFLLDLSEFDRSADDNFNETRFTDFISQCASSLEKEFLVKIRESAINLPDELHKIISSEGIPVAEADFYYSSQRLCIFIDGPDHEKDYIKEDDMKKRTKLRQLGYNVIAIKSDLDLTQLSDYLKY